MQSRGNKTDVVFETRWRSAAVIECDGGHTEHVVKALYNFSFRQLYNAIKGKSVFRIKQR